MDAVDKCVKQSYFYRTQFVDIIDDVVLKLFADLRSSDPRYEIGPLVR